MNESNLTPLFGGVDPSRSTGPYGAEGPSAATQGSALHPVGSIIAQSSAPLSRTLGLVRDYVRRRWGYLLGLGLIPFAVLGPGWLQYRWQTWRRANALPCETEARRLLKAVSDSAQCQTDADCTIIKCAAPDWCRFAVNTRADKAAIQNALGNYFERCDAVPWDQDCLTDGPPICEAGSCAAASLRCLPR